MYQYSEISISRPRECTEGRAFFALYYAKTPDNSDAFKHAARTWLAVEKRRSGFRAGADIELLQGFTQEGGFRAAWRQIMYGTGGYQVFRGAVFSHASFSLLDSSQDGIEFAPGPGKDGTLTQNELSGLPRLPWADGGFLLLAGCNTGREQFRGWCPARSAANSQRVPVAGQVGSAYFSKNWRDYEAISPGDTYICLWAYQRAKNVAVIGGGQPWPLSGDRLLARVFR